jgi:tetratricopeptide (TPR) repeat protein
MLLRKAHVFMEEHPMPVVYLLLIAVVCSTAFSASANAQSAPGPIRLAAPDSQPAEPQDDELADSDAEPTTDAASPNDSADEAADADGDNQLDSPGGDTTASEGSAAPTTPPGKQRESPATAGARPLKPAVGAAPRRSFASASQKASSAIGPIEEESDENASLGGRSANAVTAASSRRAVRLNPVSFREVQAGVSTLAQLETKWGRPIRDQTKLGTGLRTYAIAPFKQIDVVIEQGKVVSIVAQLAQSLTIEEATQQFVPDAADSVEVLDEGGQALGLAFPERGVALGYASDSKDVSQLLFDPIDQEMFLMRAERNQHRAPQQSLADVEFVLKQNAKHGQALALAGQICFQAGQLTDAAAHIDRALEIAPSNAAYQLTKAEILAESGDFTASKQTCQRVLAQARLAAELKARAHCLLGDFLAAGPERDYKRAIEQHLAAIQSAQPLATSQRAATRRAAKHVLVCAQLGVANDVAWGFWQQKDKVVPKWLVAAHEVAEDLIDQEGADESLHLLVLRRALAASAGTQGKLDPVMWTKEAVKTARRLIDTSDDGWRRGRLEWELGLALYDALQADQARGYHDHALSNSSLVVKYLESSLKQRQETPHGAYLLGRLYFRVGAIHAVELNDHRSAVAWFQKGLPLLERPQPTTALADVGRLGESFVSMGISYWEAGRRDEAMRLTQHGIALVTQGVKDRALDEEALVVPYSNLAFMHRELGNVQQADSYTEMATRIGGTQRE